MEKIPYEEFREALLKYCHGKRCAECVLYRKGCYKHAGGVGKRYNDDETYSAIYPILFPDAIPDTLKDDTIEHPSHYTSGRIEVIDFIEDQKLNYHRGNAVKYISRAGKKDKTKEAEDLKKAVWYLQREISQMEGKE